MAHNSEIWKTNIYLKIETRSIDFVNYVKLKVLPE